MAIEGAGFDLLGVSVGDSAPVGRLVHLRFDAGVTALYGLNGAGKTSVLRLVRAALTGELGHQQRRATADVHVRLHEPEGTPPAFGWTERVRDVLAQSLDRERGFLRRFAQELNPESYGWDEDETGEWDYYEELGTRNIGDDIWSHLSALIDAGGISGTGGKSRSALSREVRDALQESADAGLLTLRATGTPGQPSWEVLLPLSPTSTAGATTLLSAYLSWKEFQEIAESPGGFANRLGPWLDKPSPLNLLMHGLNTLPYMRSVQRGPGDLPNWLGVPLLGVGSDLTRRPVHVLDHDAVRDALTDVSRLQDLAFPDVHFDDREPPVVASGNQFVINEDLHLRAQAVEQKVAAVLVEVLLDAPRVRFNWKSPAEWVMGQTPEWEFRDDFSDWLPIAALSEARLRWVQDAIRIATAASDIPTVLLSDEPERGLHRLAERRLSRGLGQMARDQGLSVLAASHSPALLDAQWVRPHLVSRGAEGHVTVKEVPLTFGDELTSELSALQLGLSFSDLAAMMKLAVVVEGLHDEWVIGHFLRPTLDDNLAQIFPMHGARRAQSLADARFLFSGTDGPLLIVLDNLHERAAQIWANARLAAGSSREEALEVLSPLLSDRKRFGDEYLFLHQLAVRAIETGRIDRIHVFGLTLPDVICYLPPEHVLLQCSESWQSLLSRWRSSFGGGVATNLKKWLTSQGLLPQDPAQVNGRVREAASRAAEDGVPLHPDLVALTLRVRELADSGRAEGWPAP